MMSKWFRILIFLPLLIFPRRLRRLRRKQAAAGPRNQLSSCCSSVAAVAAVAYNVNKQWLGHEMLLSAFHSCQERAGKRRSEIEILFFF
jgi:hypothetical protein